jgi:hypothetical protein
VYLSHHSEAGEMTDTCALKYLLGINYRAHYI